MKRTASLALGVALLISGCWVRSLHPIYTQKDLVSDDRIVGTWMLKGGENDDVQIAVFERGKDDAYGLVYLNDGEVGKFDARLVRVGKQLYLDIQPDEFKDLSGEVVVHLLPTHGFMKIDLGKQSFKITPMNYKWLEEKAKSGKLDLAHDILDKTVVLTASTEELQVFLKKYADDKQAFTDPATYVRH